MVNVLTSVLMPLIHRLMKLAGLRPEPVQIDPETVMNFWVPTRQSKGPGSPRPAVVLLHGFTGNGILTWALQALALAANGYPVYVPDLLFFGGSATTGRGRSPEFQAACVAKGLTKLGVERCVPVGFSYGGFVGFKMAEMDPDLVRALVVSGSAVAWTESMNRATLERIGFGSLSDFLLPKSVKGLKALLKAGSHRKFWFPDWLYKDYMKAMFSNSKERDELLDALVVRDRDADVPKLIQKIHLLWGEEDKIFNSDVVQNLREQLGERATLHYIKKGGHLVQLERPCAYNKCLKEILSSLVSE